MSIFDDIKDSAQGRELSMRWYRNTIASIGGNAMTAGQHIRRAQHEGGVSGRPIYGMMNLFHYKPAYPERLQYYDRFPLVIPFEPHSGGFTGVNFHFLSMPLRVKLLQQLTEAFGDAGTNSVDFNWRQVSGMKYIKPIVRRYKAQQVKSVFLRIPLEDMLIAVLLPVARFYPGSGSRGRINPRQVWRDTRNKL